MNEAALLIRMCYATTSDEARWRFEYFRGAVLPRILSQTSDAFDLWLWVNPAHRKEVESWSPRIRTFTVDGTMLPLESRVAWSRVHGLPRYSIQLRLDSDDLIGPKYVAVALQQLTRMAKRRALVYFDPWKYDVASGKAFLFYRHYSRKRPSAFLALRQPTDQHSYDWVYGRGHTKMHKLASQIRGIGFGHCWMSIHRFNDSTALDRRDVEIENRP